MGIPKFGAWWLKSFPLSKFDKRKVDILCIDGNALLHQVAQYVFAYHSKATNEDKERVLSNSFDKNIKIFTYNVINTITKYSDEVNPETVLFFIDGPVCMAKMMQQRSRRYLSQKHIYNDKVLFDSNNISPGTDFMVKFDEFFKAAIQKSLERLSFQLVYSSYEEVGEGEHKFINYIRDKKINSKKIALLGLDADLFMLGSIIHSFNNEVTLYRGNIYINISKAWNDLGFNQDNIYDFIYAFFLIGNDFMPKMIYFYELENNLTILWNTLLRFIKSGKSVRKNFKDFLVSLKSNESTLLTNLYKYFSANDVYALDSIKDITKAVKQISTDPFFSFTKAGPPNKFKDVISQSTFAINRMTIDSEKFRKIVYSNMINIENISYSDINDYCMKNGLSIKDYKENQYRDGNESVISSLNIIGSILENFVECLNWTYLYYTTGQIDYTWYSKFNYSPMLTDLINSYDNLNSLNFSLEEQSMDENELFYRKNPEFIDIKTQLRIIMPPSYQKDIESFGPFEVIKDNVFFPKEGFHNYIAVTPFYPVELELQKYKDPYYIYYNKNKVQKSIVSSEFIENKFDPKIYQEKISVLRIDMINYILSELYKSNNDFKNYKLNTDFIDKDIMKPQHIVTVSNMVLEVPKGTYLLKSLKGNTEYILDDIKSLKSVLKFEKDYILNFSKIEFLNNDHKVIIIPLVRI